MAGEEIIAMMTWQILATAFLVGNSASEFDLKVAQRPYIHKASETLYPHP